MKSKKRNARKGKQRVAKRYSKAREDAQLAGLIPTDPSGAIRAEQVDPSTQDQPALPGLVGLAVRKGWATPEEVKIRTVDELARIVEDETQFAHVRVAAARVLQQGDKQQWEQDNPDLAGRMRGSTNVNVAVQTETKSFFTQLLEAVANEQVDAVGEVASDGGAAERMQDGLVPGGDGHQGPDGSRGSEVHEGEVGDGVGDPPSEGNS